jgi:hypothetical protein
MHQLWAIIDFRNASSENISKIEYLECEISDKSNYIEYLECEISDESQTAEYLEFLNDVYDEPPPTSGSSL